jgi:predicted anti-sigma-YlaC factor YlaD
MTAHLQDATLVRQLDGALEDDEIAIVPLHLASCGACAERLATLGRRFERLGELLAATDVPVPTTALRAPRRFVPQRAGAAAAVVLAFATGVVAVRPARAWIVERSVELWTLVTGGAEAAPAVDEGPAAPTATAAAVSFTPSGQQFLIRVTGYQLAGTVTVETAAVSEVTAEVRGGGETEDIVVLPDGLRIVNAGQSTADYHVLVPATLREITVEVAGRVAARLEPSGALSTWTVLLRANRAG